MGCLVKNFAFQYVTRNGFKDWPEGYLDRSTWHCPSMNVEGYSTMKRYNFALCESKVASNKRDPMRRYNFALCENKVASNKRDL